MSGPEGENHEARGQDEGDQAVFKPSRWPGLIWAVPVAALAIVGWLGTNAFLQSGPSVTVDFPIAGGLKAGTTKVEYRGFDVGEVSSVHLAKSLDHMVVGISMDADMAHSLGPGTQYWIAGNSFSLSDLSAIKALVSGPFIGIDPKPGKTVAKAKGLGKPPVLKEEPQGETLTLVADRLSNLSPGSPIYYKGYKVGEIQGIDMQPNGKQFDIYAFIERRWENLLNSDSRFWDAGAVRVSMSGAGPGIQLQSVPALFLGAVAFETPDNPPGQKIGNGAKFKLYSGQDAAQDAPGPGAVPYRAMFAGGPNGLTPGAAVQLEGTPAGAVTKVTMQYVPAQGAMQTVVDFVLQPERVGLGGAPWNMANPAPQMNAMLSTLVAHGLRAEIGSAIPLVGGKTIELTLVKGQPKASLGQGNPPEIPFFGSGGGAGQIIAQVNDILATVNAMPLQQIAANIHQATSNLAQLTKSPKTKRTLERLDQTVAHVDAITRQVNTQLPALLSALKGTLANAQSALNQAKGMLSSQGPVNASPESSDIPHALYELSQAAQSLRALTDFLNSHPSALILGRGD